MSLYEYRLIAAGWFLLILLLSIFWYATLRRLAEVMKQHIADTRSREMVPDFFGVALYILRGQFKNAGDGRFVAVCKRLRQLLYGYLGAVGAYLVFLVIIRPHG